MADSFFGFDTSLPPDDDVGGLDDDELEYDALNDETFGSAINGDWEGIHENLVKLEDELKRGNGASRKPSSRENTSRSRYGGDLDINLSRVSLDDCFVECLDEPETPLKLDSSVWSSPQFNALSKDSKAPKPVNNASPRPKMFTVEDIERSIRVQPRGSEALGAPLHYTEPISHRPILPPPGLLPSPMAQPLFNVPPMKQPPFRPPADFPLMHLMTSMGAPPMPRPMPPANMPPMAYNNLAMHSSFGGVRPPPMQGQPRMNPLLNGPPFPTPPPPAPPMQNNPVSVNQYNKRLVQEIQQNHPMLYFNRLNNFEAASNSYHQNQMNGSKNNNQNHQQHRFKQQQQQQQHQRDGNLNLEEYDEYANLMSQRNKQWLIGIQLLQLNTETPYIDDYYYEVYKERRMKRERESKAHRDNQMNHPLTQPKGHQQLVLMSMGKNGTNQRSHERDKKNQDRDNKGEKEMTPRTYTPLQFENSLGKLQCGSVTAPRKIIDMDIMGPDTAPQLTSTIELTTQKKSRQMLLHIESLYKIVLKVEDLKNPIAVATALVVKAKKERERKQALDQLESEEEPERSRQAVLEAIEEKFPEPEKLEDLLPMVVAGLSVDKVMGMMNVRKGRTLIKRSLPHLVDEEHKWQVWQAIFAVLPIIAKKDREDTDGSLAGLFTEFKNHLIVAKLSDFITVPKAIVAANKKLNYIFGNKFGMLSIIAMMLRVETIFQVDELEMMSIDGAAWRQFVVTLAACAAKQPLTDTEQSLDKEILQILLNHLRRFPEVEAQPLTTALSQVEFK